MTWTKRACTTVVTVAFAASFEAACGGKVWEEPALTSWKSGTRLRARIYDAGGGAVRLAGWHDTKLDVDCTFERAEDGAYHCMPRGASVSSHFADAACKEPAAYVLPDCGNAPRYARKVIDECASKVQVFEIRARIDAVYASYRGCRVETDTQSYAFYSIAPVAASTWVRAEEEIEPRSDQLGARVLVAEDGAREVVDLVDSARQVACGADASGRCVPTAHASPIFLDRACTEPGVELYAQCPAPHLFAVAQGPACNQRTHVYEPGPTRSPTYFKDNTGECGPTTGPTVPPHAGAAFGREVPIEDLPPVRDDLPSGRGRVRLLHYGDAKPILARTFEDTKLGIECVAFELSDGHVRCMPPSGGGHPGDFGSRRRYADRECRVRVIPDFSTLNGDCPPPALAKFVFGVPFDEMLRCEAPEVFRIGKRVEAAPFERDASGKCMQTDLPAYFELTPLDFSEFAELAERIE